MARKVKTYIQDTNDVLKKVANPRPLSGELFLCTIDVKGLYLNIPHEDVLIAISKAFHTRKYQTISTDSLIKFAECFLNCNRN